MFFYTLIALIMTFFYLKHRTILYLKLLNPQASVPHYATPQSAGFDLYSAETYTLDPKQILLVKTGLSFQIPSGYEVQIRSRSGMALKHGVCVLNSPGTIDSDYRGEIGVILYNVSETPFDIPRGMKIAQGVLAPYVRATFQGTLQLNQTTRGEGGLGSTGS